MPSGIGAPEILLILVALVLLFGAKRLPDTARSLGKSMRIFKSETKAMREEEAAAQPQPPRGIESGPVPAPPVPPAPSPGFHGVRGVDRSEH
jgi:sec-independent protein translocase protein TatA